MTSAAHGELIRKAALTQEAAQVMKDEQGRPFIVVREYDPSREKIRVT